MKLRDRIYELWTYMTSPCPCGMFCKDCLRGGIETDGLLGILWHLIFHSPLGLLTFRSSIWMDREEMKVILFDNVELKKE